MTKKKQGNTKPKKPAPPKKRKVYIAAVDGAKDQAMQAAIAKLESSGLTLQDAEDLGIEIVPASKTQGLCSHFKPLPCLKFNYFDISGKPYKVMPKWPDFFRIRYLGESNDFTQITAGKNPRYTQPPDSGVAAYFPRIIDWEKVAADPGYDLIITEGELKAAKACKEDFNTIGLGGVWNYRSQKIGASFLPELEKINWVKRNVRICFDSDYQTKSDICAAINGLADELVERGAFVLLATLPEVAENGKTGLDDFLVLQKSGDALKEVLEEAQPITLVRPMWKLNNEVCYVRNPGVVVNHNTFEKMAPGGFKDHAYATANVSERVVKSDGSISLKKVSAAGAWLKWPYRLEAPKMTYAPGKERFVKEEGGALNIWEGWGCEPKKGDVSLFLKLVDHIFTGATKEEKHWFMCWLAYPLQYPGTKMFTSCVVHGLKHGTGKSLIGYTMKHIYGKNFAEISQADLHGTFNGWAEARQFVMGDDVTGSNKRQDNDKLKKLISQLELRINTKFVPEYTVADVINYYFTSNHPDCFFLEDDDRRAFIWEVTVGKLEQSFYSEYTKALNIDKTLGPAVFDYLLNYNTKGFNPAAPALVTEAKERMITGAQSELGVFCRKVMQYPDTVLRMGGVELKQDVFTAKQLCAMFVASGGMPVTSNGMAREMIRAGALHACKGKAIRVHNDVDRYIAVRNTHQWATASTGQVVKHIDSMAIAPIKGTF